jgi:serine/threonine-protein kinase
MMTSLSATLSKYRLLARLGSGGMAEVYLVLNEKPGGFNKLQVLKIMRSDFTELERPEFLQMFRDEAKLAARLNHPNIVQSFEVDTDAGQPFIAMEFLEGQPLHRVQQRSRHLGGGFSLEMELFVLCQVLEGLEYAHTLRDYAGNPLHIVHRDVSPQNVFITYSGQTKLVDFGVAKTLESSKTRAGVVKGKVAYMPPEQVSSGPIDHRADLFSVGVLLWEAIAKQPMHAELSVFEALSRLVRGQLPKLRDIVPSVDPELERIVEHALELEPDARYQDADSFRGDLLTYLDKHSRVRARDVGQAVAQLFETERAELSEIIRRATSGEPPPREELPRPFSITRRLPRDETPASDPTEPAPAALGGGLSSQPSAATSAPEPRVKAWIASAAGLAVIALIVGVAVFGSREAETKQASASDPAPPPSAASAPEQPPAPEPAPAPISVAIEVEPKNASLTLDGRALADNPYQAQQARDAREHVLLASAPGYLPLSKTLTFDGDVSLRLQLQKQPPPAVKSEPRSIRPPAQHRAAPTKPSLDEYPDLPAPKRVRSAAPELDKSDPWSNQATH